MLRLSHTGIKSYVMRQAGEHMTKLQLPTFWRIAGLIIDNDGALDVAQKIS